MHEINLVKNKFCASSWLITKINIGRCTVSKTSKFGQSVVHMGELGGQMIMFIFVKLDALLNR